MNLNDFEIFTGCNFSIEENEYLMFKNVKPKYLMREREAMDSRWFDYRWMHPTSATLLFDHIYAQERKKAYRRDVDIKKAEELSIVRESLFSRSQGIISQTWSARQMADLICCPYDIFIAAGIYEARNLGWKQPPSPGQLPSADILAGIIDYWNGYQEAALPQPVRKDLIGVGAEDSPWKMQYQFWLAAEIESRPGPLRILLSSAIAMSQLLEESVAREYFGDEIVNDALSCFNLDCC